MAEATAKQNTPDADGSRPQSQPTLVPLHETKGMPEYLRHKLEDAEHLILYAAEIGVEIEDPIRAKVFSARQTSRWSEQQSSDLLSALTALSARLKPVSGDSLRRCVIVKDANRTLRRYQLFAIVLGIFIVAYSILAFVASASCDAIHKDIDLANGLAVTLASTAKDVVVDRVEGDQRRLQYGRDDVRVLQQFAAVMRSVYSRAEHLNHLAFVPSENFIDKTALELRVNVRPDDETHVNLAPGEAKRLILEYQAVRDFGQSVREAVSTTFGAVTLCLLPIFYALLGACAYLVREFEEQIKSRTFTGANKPVARFLIAGIGGLVVGLFNDFSTGHGTSLPPLAVAFLVGYSADMFFSFLDGLLRAVRRPAAAAQHERIGRAQRPGQGRPA